MKTIYLWRHAKAEAASPGGDAERHLTKRGRKAAAAMAAFLGRLSPAPELALCSPAARTRDTLDFLLEGSDRALRVVYEKELYLAEPERLLRRLTRLPNEIKSVLLVGHNPGLHELGARLANDPGPLAERFPTGALVALSAPDEWEALHWHEARLTLYRTPKQLSADHDREDD